MKKLSVLLLALLMALPAFGTGIEFDVTRPYNSDTISVLDDYIRETRQDVYDFAVTEHATTGVHKIPSTTTANLPDETPSGGRLMYNSTTSALLYGTGSVWASTNGSMDVPYTLISNYSSSLNTAVSALGATETLLIIDVPVTLTASVVVPSTMDIWFMGEGKIILGNYNLTMNGSFHAPKNTIFDYTGSGAVTIGSAVEKVYTIWFSQTDIGARVNAAVAAISATECPPIEVMPDEWCGVTYTTGIVISKPVEVRFPGARTTAATYTGTVAGVKLTTNGVRISGGLHLSLSGNANPTADGFLIYAASDCVISDGINVESAPQRGISIDAVSTGASQNVFNGVTRVSGGSTGGSLVWLGTTGASSSNSNRFEHIVVNGIPNSGYGLHVAYGFANSFPHYYSNGGLSVGDGGDGSAWAVFIEGLASGQTYIGNCGVEGAGNGLKVSTGYVHISQFRSTVTGTTESITRPNAVVSYNYLSSGWYENLFTRYLLPNSIATAHPHSNQSVIFGSITGGVVPFDETGNLIISPRSHSTGTRDIVFMTGYPADISARISRTGAITGLRFTNGPVGSGTLTPAVSYSTIPNTNVTANSIVIIMPTSAGTAAAQSNNPGIYHSANIAGAGFVLGHSPSVGSNCTFNYILLN